MTKVEFIKQELDNKKLRKALQEVVEDVDALIPQDESEFADLQKFGLYPAEECVPFVTDAGTPFYSLDNMVAGRTKSYKVLTFFFCLVKNTN